MKYALQDTYWWFDTKDYIDHKDTAWVRGVRTATFKERPKTPYAIYTKRLSEAKLYDTSIEAVAVASLLSVSECATIVIGITDKRLFEARLQAK